LIKEFLVTNNSNTEYHGSSLRPLPDIALMGLGRPAVKGGRTQRRPRYFITNGQVSASSPLNAAAKRAIRLWAQNYNALHKLAGQHWGPISRAFMDVLHALLYSFHNCLTGACYPSYAAIAEKAKCCRDTVRRALRLFEDIGLLTWAHSIRRVAVAAEPGIPAGWKARWRIVRSVNIFRFFRRGEAAKVAGGCVRQATETALAVPNNQQAENQPGNLTPKHLKILTSTQVAKTPELPPLEGLSESLQGALRLLGTAIVQKEGLKPT
jgi:hypothetical protein